MFLYRPSSMYLTISGPLSPMHTSNFCVSNTKILCLRKSFRSCAQPKHRDSCISKIFGEIKTVKSRRLCFKHRKQSRFEHKHGHKIKSYLSSRSIEGNLMTEQRDGLTKSYVIKDKNLWYARIPNKNACLFETQMPLCLKHKSCSSAMGFTSLTVSSSHRSRPPPPHRTWSSILQYIL